LTFLEKYKSEKDEKQMEEIVKKPGEKKEGKKKEKAKEPDKLKPGIPGKKNNETSFFIG